MLLPEKQAIDFEARNIMPGYRAAKRIHTVNLEIDEETWTMLKLLPDGAILRGMLYWTQGDDEASEPELKVKKPKAERKKKEPKGPHGAFWQEMTKRGIFNHPDLPEAVRQVIGPFTGGLKDAFKLAYGVDSLTFISPEMFEAWSEARDLHQLVSMSRQASAKVQEKV